jgi:RsiW-degrading membrane proteinase PrsW (M82 family)
MQLYLLLIYILFGILPSLTWLSFYLREDAHPEPKRMILKVFLLGAMITVPVFFIQIALSEWLSSWASLPLFASFPVLIDIIRWFIVIALTEEVLKYLVVRVSVFKNKELDEPLDIMLYMVITALGFAAVENVLYLLSPMGNFSFASIIEATAFITFLRFIGATFLHTLCSAVLGYFLAMSFFHVKERTVLMITGLLVAVLLHGLYDFSIITLDQPMNILFPVAIIVVLAIFVLHAFSSIKKLKSISQI